MSNVTRIVVDGRTYNSPEDMPPEVRKAYEESLELLGQAQPEAGENMAEHRVVLPGVTVATRTYGPVRSERFVWNGQEYDSAENLPPEARAHFERIRKDLASGQLAPTGAHDVKIERLDRQTMQFGINAHKAPAGIAGYAAALIALLLLLAFLLWRYLS